MRSKTRTAPTAFLKKRFVMDPNRSWPAVSIMFNFMIVLSFMMDLGANSIPTVEGMFMLNSSREYRANRHDLPAAEFPSKWGEIL